MGNTIAGDATVAELVTEKPSRGRVFEKYKIDYCCAGNVPVAEACAKKGIPAEQLLDELEKHDAASAAEDAGSTSWATAPIGDLIDNIVTKHHDYLREELPRLLKKAERVAAVHGSNHPETIEVLSVFREMKDEMEEHMGKEEGVLFPWIRGLEQGKGQPPFPGMKMQQPVKCMMEDHEKTGAALEKIQELTGDYTPPPDACNTFRVLYEGLREVELDMHKHVHKENSILFPRALELAG